MNKIIASLGDSIMKGVVMEPAQDEMSRPGYHVVDENVMHICGRELGAEVCNYAVFGSTIRKGMQALSRHEDVVGRSEYTLLEYGGNDSDHCWRAIAADPTQEHEAYTPLHVFADTYRELVNRVRELGSEPVMLSLPPIDVDRYFRFLTKGMSGEQVQNIRTWLGGPTHYIDTWHQMYNLEIFKLAQELGCKLVDISSIFMVDKRYNRYLCEDGIHPNGEGQQIIANAIVSVLRH